MPADDGTLFRQNLTSVCVAICQNLSVQCELALRDTHMIHMTHMIEYKIRSFEEYNIHSFQ